MEIWALPQEVIIRWSGVTLGLAGAVLASPDGTRRLLGGMRQAIRTIFGQRRQQDNPNAAAIHSHLSGKSCVEAELTWGPNSLLEHRIEILLGRIEGLKAKLTEVRKELNERLDIHGNQILDLRRALDEVQQTFHRRIDTSEERAARIDAFGLPVIGLGIFLSGVPEELASIPWLGITLTTISAVVSIIVLMLGIQRGAWSGQMSWWMARKDYSADSCGFNLVVFGSSVLLGVGVVPDVGNAPVSFGFARDII